MVNMDLNLCIFHFKFSSYGLNSYYIAFLKIWSKLLPPPPPRISQIVMCKSSRIFMLRIRGTLQFVHQFMEWYLIQNKGNQMDRICNHTTCKSSMFVCSHIRPFNKNDTMLLFLHKRFIDIFYSNVYSPIIVLKFSFGLLCDNPPGHWAYY